MATVGYSLSAMTYGSLLLALILIRSPPPRWLPLRALGIGAYSIYLFHLLITNTIVAVGGLSWQIAAWPASLLSVMLSLGCWTFIERPIIHWAKAPWTYDRHLDRPLDAFALRR